MQDATKGTNGKPVLPIKMGRSLCLASRLWQLLPPHYADPFERPGSLSATSKLRSFGRARDAWYSKRAFESGAVPVCEISRRLTKPFSRRREPLSSGAPVKPAYLATALRSRSWRDKTSWTSMSAVSMPMPLTRPATASWHAAACRVLVSTVQDAPPRSPELFAAGTKFRIRGTQDLFGF